MKVLADDTLTPNNPGSVTFIPEEPDDLWLIYTLIAAGDTITAIKYLCNRPDSAKSEAVVKVISASFDNNSSEIHVKGRLLVPIDYVKGFSAKAGVHYNVTIEINNEYNLMKKKWNDDGIKSISEASEASDRSTSDANLAVVLISEGFFGQIFNDVGQYDICLFSKTVCDINESEFFQIMFDALAKHVDLDSVRCLAIGSPGVLKTEFRQFILSKSSKLKITKIEKNKSKIVLVNTSSAKKNCLKEVLQDTSVLRFIKDTKSAVEIKLYKKFTELLAKDSDLVAYGLKNIEMAQDFGAIETLMITEDLIRSKQVSMMNKCSELVKQVKASGGNAVVFSTEYISGEELAKFSGVAAILRFPLPDIDGIEL